MKDVLDYFSDLPDYPGKSKPRNRGRSSVKAARDLSFDIFDGVPCKLIEIDGELRDFYTIGSFARIVGRSHKTVRSWEDKGWLPKATYRSSKASGHPTVNKKNRGYRLYSREQVQVVYKALEVNGLLGGRTNAWRESHRWVNFIDYVKANWPR
jgi:hypothetical protein